MKLTSAFLLTFASVATACPSSCSGNGICGAQSKCSCYQNWQAADCSERTCPSTFAWADTADGTNQAHYYAECGNKGICDRKSGECKCFDGYEGKGCRRSTCPDGCSGHGTCEYIEELAGDFDDRRNGPGNKYKDLTCSSQSDGDPGTGLDSGDAPITLPLTQQQIDECTNVSLVLVGDGQNCMDYHLSPAGRIDMGLPPLKEGKVFCGSEGLYSTNVVARSANTDKYHGHQYNLWDAGKIQGCKCDLGYNGPDCASREVPRGDDALTTVKATSQKQAIQITGTLAAGDQFFLNYFDPYGGKWTTNTVNVPGAGSAADDAIVAALTQDRLRELPNGVLDGVKVKATTANQALCHRFFDGVQHISAYSQSTDGNFKNSGGSTNFCATTAASGVAPGIANIDLTVEFADTPGQTGVQYLLEVDLAAAGAGSFPVSSGVATTASLYVTVAEINYNDNLGNLSELSSCSDRGLDNGDGECECFDGFRGLACEEQEALV